MLRRIPFGVTILQTSVYRHLIVIIFIAAGFVFHAAIREIIIGAYIHEKKSCV